MRFYFQSGSIPDHNTDLLIDAANELNYEWGIFNFIPGTDYIFYDNNLYDDSTRHLDSLVFPHGSTAILDFYYRRLLPQNWKIYHSRETFDVDCIRACVKDYLFNPDFKRTKYSKIAAEKFSEDVFIKPTTDEKFLSGLLLPHGTTLRDYLSKNTMNNLTLLEDKELIVCSAKETSHEFRVFVVDGNAVASSSYKSSGYLDLYTHIHLSEYYKIKEIVSLYQPSRHFVIDFNIDRLTNKVTIMEYNCIHCSGFYKSDVNKIFRELYESTI